MGVLSAVLATIGALTVIVGLSYLIYYFCCSKRRAKNQQTVNYPAAQANPAMGAQGYPGTAPYPTGPTFPMAPGDAHPPYPTTNVTTQSGAGWGAPGSGWGGPNSPPPPYPGS